MPRDHGRPAGRKPPSSRSVPPHVIAERRAWDEYKRKTTPEQRASIGALLHGQDPDVGEGQLRLRAVREAPLFEPLFGAAFGGFTCCYCDEPLDGGYEWAVGSRLRCLRPPCHAADERHRARTGEGG
jgi:hypothetical protein